MNDFYGLLNCTFWPWRYISSLFRLIDVHFNIHLIQAKGISQRWTKNMRLKRIKHQHPILFIWIQSQCTFILIENFRAKRSSAVEQKWSVWCLKSKFKVLKEVWILPLRWISPALSGVPCPLRIPPRSLKHNPIAVSTFLQTNVTPNLHAQGSGPRSSAQWRCTFYSGLLPWALGLFCTRRARDTHALADVRKHNSFPECK